MAISEVQICSMALLKFGDLVITSITSPTNKQERACAIYYPIMRDKLLYAHPWNFAVKRADISAIQAATPPFEWDYAYTLPANCLRVLELYGTTANWVVEGGALKTNLDSEIYIKYVEQVTASGRLSPTFVSCLSVLLGAELAAQMVGGSEGSKKRLELLDELNRVELPLAYRLNSMEGNPILGVDEQPLDEGNYSWQTIGR